VAILTTAVLSAALIFLTQVEAVLVAAAVALIYLAYLLCTGAALWARLRGWPQTPGSFTLGKYGLAINVAAVIWGVAMIINLGWYRPVSTQPFYLNAAVPIFVPLIVVLGAIYYYGWQRRRPAAAGSAEG
jgi:hypothetical protein